MSPNPTCVTINNRKPSHKNTYPRRNSETCLWFLLSSKSCIQCTKISLHSYSYTYTQMQIINDKLIKEIHSLQLSNYIKHRKPNKIFVKSCQNYFLIQFFSIHLTPFIPSVFFTDNGKLASCSFCNFFSATICFCCSLIINSLSICFCFKIFSRVILSSSILDSFILCCSP